MKTLIDIAALIHNAKSARDVFGDDIDKSLQELQVVCHPDRHPNNPLAEELFKQLGVLADEARKPPVKLKSTKREYTLLKRLAVGDVADVYFAESEGKEYIVKASRVNGGVALLENEKEAIAALMLKAGTTHYKSFFPQLCESFPARDKIQKRINVFTYQDGLYSLEQVLAKHPDGLDGRHLAWVFKRLLTAIGFAHQAGLVHGAVLPSHVLLSVANHGLKLVGWGHSCKTGERIKTISTKYKDWYPVEVTKKQAAGAYTDIYLAARCIEYIAGKQEIPDPIKRYLRACMLPGPQMRPDNAWDELDRFDEVLRGHYGLPKFVELSMT